VNGRFPGRGAFLCARVILGLLFLYASFDKIIHPAAFAEAVKNYQLLPPVLINLTAVILPWLELFLGLFLVLGIWTAGAALWSSVLMSVFLGTFLFNLARGLDVDCGCFSSSNAGAPASVLWYLFRDSAFLALALFVLFGRAGRKGSKLPEG
jgi:uncharacterized membrane protein YphA (DoxX/SURF4 family)